MVGWLRRLCGGWVRNAGNKAQLRPAGAGALPELGNIKYCLRWRSSTLSAGIHCEFEWRGSN